MVLVKRELETDVVTAARERVLNVWRNGLPVYLAMSGGKDSICLASIVYDLMREGRIDPALLTVDFIDEEAIFDDVEQIVREWRMKFLEIGARFNWWCIEVKHFNCFNQLSNDESFITWDRTQRANWIRPMPPFAVTDHPLLHRRGETYQKFLTRLHADGIDLIGLRTAESVQRLYSVAARGGIQKAYPIYDWSDPDVWRYIRDHGLNFPTAYMSLYQTGSSRREMRISQFFSIDTSKVLVKMAEYYPDLMERIERREPNAYLASLYWDSEMFRRGRKPKANKDSTEVEETVDYRAKVFEFIQNPANANSDVRRRNIRSIRQIILKFAPDMIEKNWKTAYNILVGGDPKDRTIRALRTDIRTAAWKAMPHDDR